MDVILGLSPMVFVVLSWASIGRHVWVQQTGRGSWHWGKLAGLCAALFSFTAHLSLAHPIDVLDQAMLALITFIAIVFFFFGWFFAHVLNGITTTIRRGNGWL